VLLADVRQRCKRAGKYEGAVVWIREADATLRVQLRWSGSFTQTKEMNRAVERCGTSAGRKKQMCCKKMKVWRGKIDDQRLRFKIDSVSGGNRE
jgi:hypothetical protein